MDRFWIGGSFGDCHRNFGSNVMFAKGIPHNFSRFRVFSLFILFAWCRSTARTLMQSRSPISFFDFPLASRRYSLKSFLGNRVRLRRLRFLPVSTSGINVDFQKRGFFKKFLYFISKIFLQKFNKQIPNFYIFFTKNSLY